MEGELKEYIYPNSFELESGAVYPEIKLGYHTYGKLNDAKDNVVWVFHALTANSDAVDWWHGLIGDGKLFDPARDFIICVNIPGSCYGSTSPLDHYHAYHAFQFFTTRDIIRTFQYLKNELGINKIRVGIGGSLGGQQLLEWAIEEPELFESIIPLATNAQHSAWGVAFNASQRMCIENDETWKQKEQHAGVNGMKIARGIALISYRHYDTYHASQSHSENDILQDFKSESYQRYQGEKLAKRFNAFSYYFLTKTMDAHNVGRDRGGLEEALSLISAKTLVIGISSDILFPISEQQFLADNIRGAHLEIIDSLYGHDGFLLEFEKIETCITKFLNR